MDGSTISNVVCAKRLVEEEVSLLFSSIMLIHIK